MASGGGNFVTPAEVHADALYESDVRDNDSLEGYIALHFPDSAYYVNEDSIILGRDTRLQEFLEKHKDIRVTTTHPTYQPPRREEYHDQLLDKVHERSDHDSDDSYDEEDFLPTEPRFASLEGGIATFDINLQRKIGINNDTFLPIHPPGDAETGRFPSITSISKQHLRIYVNNDEDCWMVEILGRNGAYVDHEYVEPGTHVQLEHMTAISVGGLVFKVAYQDVSGSELDDEDSSSGEDDDSVGGSETTPESTPVSGYRKKAQGSADSDDSEEDVEDTVEPVTPKPGKPPTKLKLKVPMKASEKGGKDDKQPKTPKEKEKEKDKDKDKVPKKPKETSEEAQKKIMSLLQPGEEPGRRKGPGRPPANGLMSKREMKERQKALADAAKREKDGSTGDVMSPTADIGGDIDIKGDPDKANSKKRKRSNTTGDPKADNGDRKKRATPEKSPEPTEDQFTAEQLQPPGLTYVVIIYRILQDMHPEQLNLQQLYREMKKRYPYYRFRPKPGWESSVRHTVSAHNFIKGEKDGKGYKYTYNPDEPPAPQKQKQVTASSHSQSYPNGFGQRPASGQYMPGNYQGAGYGYGQAYHAGAAPQNAYGQNLAMHSQRPLANGATQPAPYQPGHTAAAQQMNPARNPQNSPYPINPTVAGLTPTTQAAQGAAQRQTQPVGVANAATTNYSASGPPSAAAATTTFPRPPIGNAAQQANQAVQQPTTGAQQGPSLARPLQAQPQGSLPAQQQQQAPRSHTGTPHSLTPAHNHGPSRPPPTPATQSQPSAAQSSTGPQTQQPPRPGSQQASTPTSVTPAKAPSVPTASEELAQGRIPVALTNFEANMKRLASNMPQRQQDVEMQAISQAMQWIRDNPAKDFAPEAGMSSYTISVISNMRTIISRQDAEILRARQAQNAGTRPTA